MRAADRHRLLPQPDTPRVNLEGVLTQRAPGGRICAISSLEIWCKPGGCFECLFAFPALSETRGSVAQRRKMAARTRIPGLAIPLAEAIHGRSGTRGRLSNGAKACTLYRCHAAPHRLTVAIVVHGVVVNPGRSSRVVAVVCGGLIPRSPPYASSPTFSRSAKANGRATRTASAVSFVRGTFCSAFFLCNVLLFPLRTVTSPRNARRQRLLPSGVMDRERRCGQEARLEATAAALRPGSFATAWSLSAAC